MTTKNTKSSPEEQNAVTSQHEEQLASNALMRFEALVMELNRAVFQYGLFLPPIEMWEHCFRSLEALDMIYGVSLLKAIYEYVENPNILISRYWITDKQLEDAKSSEKKFDNLFRNDCSLGDKPFYAQTLFYLNRANDLSEVTRIYRDYMKMLLERLCVISRQKYHMEIVIDFTMTKKIHVDVRPDALEKVADLLVEEQCINDDDKSNFLAIFDNILLRVNWHPIVWRKKAKSDYTNVAYLKEMFVALGVDMESHDNRELVKSFVVREDGKELDIRTKGERPGKSKDIQKFGDKIRMLVGLPLSHNYAPRKLFHDVFRMSGSERHRVRLRLGVKAHRLLIEDYPRAKDNVSVLDETHWSLDAFVADYSGVGRFVIGLADDIEIIDTPELEQYVKEFTNKFLTPKN